MSIKYTNELFEDIERHDNSIYILEHELTEVVPQHKHLQGHILYVLEGVAMANVENSTFYIPNGYFVWIPPKISHRISFQGKRVNILNIYFPSAFIEQDFHKHVGVYPTPSLLYHTIEMVHHTAVYKTTDWMFNLLSTMYKIIPHLINPKAVQLRLPTTNNPTVLKILDFIHDNYNKQITAQIISDKVGMSIRSFSRYLRKELDLSFIQYLRTYRIMMAIQMIIKNDISITDVAYSVGYESLTAFSNSFYIVTGYRPSQFLHKNYDRNEQNNVGFH